MKKFVIIVAGGKGSRMQSETPKQFLEICGKPVIMHTIEAFLKFDPAIEIIVVLPSSQFSYWKKMCADKNFRHEHKLTAGGNTRVDSVKNGLDQINEEGIVFIHDGVRPLVSQQTIKNCYEGTKTNGSAIPVIELTDSIRELTDQSSQAVDRTLFRLVQTPQTFKVSLIKEAFKKIDDNHYTDDASIFESAGFQINLVEGNKENLKITVPTDLKVAALYLRS